MRGGVGICFRATLERDCQELGLSGLKNSVCQQLYSCFVQHMQLSPKGSVLAPNHTRSSLIHDPESSCFC